MIYKVTCAFKQVLFRVKAALSMIAHLKLYQRTYVSYIPCDMYALCVFEYNA
jgi:hypothetical protein